MMQRSPFLVTNISASTLKEVAIRQQFLFPPDDAAQPNIL